MWLTFTVAGKTPLQIRNREPGNVDLHELGQVLGATDGSQIYAYDTQLSRRVYRMTLANVSRIDRDRFQAFFDNDARGVFIPFTVSIPGGAPEAGENGLTISGARFLAPALEWTAANRDGWHSVSFDIYTQSEGPTAPPT